LKLKPVYITIEDEDGNIIERIPYTAAADDWIRAGRLSQKAKAGDKDAARELEKMENTQMMESVEDDEVEHDNGVEDLTNSNRIISPAIGPGEQKMARF